MSKIHILGTEKEEYLYAPTIDKSIDFEKHTFALNNHMLNLLNNFVYKVLQKLCVHVKS